MKPTIGIMTVVVAISCVHDVNSLNILPVTDFGSPSAPNALDSFCPQICPVVMSPVFDENGVMYSNRCKMQAAKCKQRKNDGITSLAPTKAPSNLDSFCPEVCPAVMKPVFDENGVMYTNECKMQAAKCKKKKHAKVETDESDSNTDDSASDEEASDEDDSDGVTQDGSSSPSMKCKGACPDIKLLVCGSDGVKYANPCQLELARCKNPELNFVEDDDAACFSAKKTTTQDEKTVVKLDKKPTILAYNVPE